MDAAEALAQFVVDVPDFPEPGVVFKDISPLLADPEGFGTVVEALAACGRDAGRHRSSSTRSSAWRREASSSRLRSLSHSGVGFVPVRKAGKLPRATYAVSYALEYAEATLELHRDAIAPGDRVLLVDDVLATGGTVKATQQLVEQCGGTRRRRGGADGADLPPRPGDGR